MLFVLEGKGDRQTDIKIFKYKSFSMPKNRNAKQFLGVYRLHYSQPGKTFSVV